MVKKCCKCKLICLKTNFKKIQNLKMDYNLNINLCVNDYNKNYYNKNRDSELERRKKYNSQNRGKINEYIKNKMKTDLQFKIARYMRNWLYKVYKAQKVRKTNKTFDLFGCSHSFFKSWIIHQSYGNMTLEKYGSVWQIDHCLAIASFNILDEKEMKKCFFWINLRPMYVKNNIIKGDKIDMRLCLLQEKKSNYLMKLNVYEG